MATFSIDFFSEALNRKVSCKVLLPTDQPAFIESGDASPIPTLYLLHGMTGSSSDWTGMGNLWRLAREYRICIVMPNGENSFYADSCLINRGFSRFIEEELVAFTRRTFPLSHKREETFIAGLSMGGFGAVNCGLRSPGTFGYVAAFSAALIKKLILRADDEEGLDYFTRRQYQTMFGLEQIEDFNGCRSDYEALAEALARSGGEKPKFYIDCGTEDVSLYRANLAFKDKLLSLGYDVTWDSRPGGHDMDFWNDSIVKAFQWLPIQKLALDPKGERARQLKRMNDAMTRKMTEE